MSYRYNNNISDVNFRYILQTKKDYSVINKSVTVDYNKMIDILELKNDDLGISYNKCTTRQLQRIQHMLLKVDDIIKCNVYVGDQIIL